MRALIRPDCVHRDVYIEPAIFNMELSHIFARCWNYMCHESQLPQAGDYLTTSLIGKPVIVIRDHDNHIRVLPNRCAHRGARLLERNRGNTKVLTCCYHGWRYRTDGKLLSMPCREHYHNTEAANNPPDYSLAKIRSDSYRGFVFANLSGEAPALTDFLGGARRSLDNMIERSPEGEIEAFAGSFRALYECNWKIYLENLHDGLHPQHVHQSSIAASREQLDDMASAPGGAEPFPLQLMQTNARSYRQMQELEVACYAYGHSDMRGFRNPDTNADPLYRDYVARHRASYGMERSSTILNMNLHNVNFYPGASAHPRFLQLRALRPLAADKTAIEIQVFRWKGAPDEINQRNIVYANTVHSPSSLIKTDDLEAYRRVQEGLRASGNPWVNQRYMYDPAADDTASQSALSEHYIRNQYRAWLAYMINNN